MKKALLALALCLAAVFPAAARGEGEGPGLFSRIRGSGKIVEKELDFRSFSAVSVSHGMQLAIRKGSGFSVRLRADDNVIDVIRTEKSGSSLRFFLPAGTGVTSATMEISIVMPALEGIEASGGSRVTVDMTGTDGSFAANLSGGSRLEGRLDARELGFDLSGGSRSRLAGTGRTLRVSGSGGSVCEFFDLKAADASADLSGGSRLETTLSGELSVNASGGSRVTIAGQVSVRNQNLSGGSRIDRR